MRAGQGLGSLPRHRPARSWGCCCARCMERQGHSGGEPPTPRGSLRTRPTPCQPSPFHSDHLEWQGGSSALPGRNALAPLGAPLLASAVGRTKSLTDPSPPQRPEMSPTSPEEERESPAKWVHFAGPATPTRPQAASLGWAAALTSSFRGKGPAAGKAGWRLLPVRWLQGA